MFMNRRQTEKFEKKQTRDQLRQQAMAGKGCYLFQNNTGADFYLPKPHNGGSTFVAKGRTFEGDSYFFCLMKTNQVKLIKELEIIPPKEEEIPMIEQKLILDQPERVTNEGAVEHVLTNPQPAKPKKAKNESRTAPKDQPDVLLTEDPMSGVEIM